MLKKFYNNPASVVIMVLAIITVGLSLFAKLPVALYPLTSKPQIRLNIKYPGTDTTKFIKDYGDTIEQGLSGVNDVESVGASYSQSSVSIDVEFDWGVEPEEAKTRVEAIVGRYSKSFPRNWRQSVFFWGNDGKEIAISAFSKSIDSKVLNTTAQESIVPRLKSIPGIDDVWVTRFDKQEIRVELIPRKMTEFGLTPHDIESKLSQYEFDLNLGNLSIEGSTQSFSVVVENKVHNIDEISNIKISESGGRAISLAKVAKLSLKELPPNRMFKGNGKRALVISGHPKPDANLSEVSKQFVDELRSSLIQLDPNIEIDVLLDPSVYINAAVGNVITAVLVGILVATLIIFLFLRQLRNTLVIAISIPLSLLGGVIIMALAGIELNLISLGAMALASGMVVDGSIVVLENAIRHLQGKSIASIRDRVQIVYDSVLEVRGSVIASLLTTVIVFSPLPFTSPLASAILGDLAKVIVCVLIVSVFVTIFFIPPLIIMFKAGDVKIKKHKVYRVPDFFNRGFNAFQALYLRLLSALLSKVKFKRLFMLMICCSVLASIYVSLNELEREVMKKPDTDKVFLWFGYKNEKLTIEQSDKVLSQYEKSLDENFSEYIKSYLTDVRDTGGWILISLKDKTRVKEFKMKLEETFKSTPFANVHVWPWSPAKLRIPNPPAISISINASSNDERKAILQDLHSAFGKIKGTGRVDSEPSTYQSSEIILTKKAHRHNQLGTFNKASSSLENIISGSLFDRLIMKVDLNGQSTPVSMSYPKGFLKSPDDIGNLLVNLGDKIVPIKTFYDLSVKKSSDSRYRENGKSRAFIKVYKSHSSDINREVLKKELKLALTQEENKKIDQTKLVFEDADKEITDNINSLTVALAAALLLILIVLTLQFASMMQTLIIMLAIPLGLIGVASALYVFDGPLSINSMLGLILLCGTAVNNSIIFVDFFNQSREQKPGTDLKDLILTTASTRFRPIMITTCTTILGMLPIACGFGEGGEVLQPLGIAVCGGLGISTLLTVLVVPLALHAATDSRPSWFFLKSFVKSTTPIVLSIFLITASPASDAEAEPLGLKQAEALALKNNHDLKASQMELRASEYNENASISKLLPKASVGVSLNRFDDVKTNSEGGWRNTSYISFSEDLSTPLVIGHQLATARINHESKQIAHQLDRIKLMADLRVEFYSVLAIKELIESSNESLALSRSHQSETKKRYEQGYVSRHDFMRAELTSQRIEIELSRLKADYEAARARLNNMLGEPAERQTEVEGRLPMDFSYFHRENILSRTFSTEQSPAVRLASLQNKKGGNDYHASMADFLPSLELKVSHSSPVDNVSNKASPTDGTYYSVGLAWELFSGGRSYFDFKSSSALKVAGKARLSQARLETQTQRVSLESELDSLKASFNLQKKQVAAAKELLSATKSNYSRGKSSSKDVADDIALYRNAYKGLQDLSLAIIKKVGELVTLTGDEKGFGEIL